MEKLSSTCTAERHRAGDMIAVTGVKKAEGNSGYCPVGSERWCAAAWSLQDDVGLLPELDLHERQPWSTGS